MNTEDRRVIRRHKKRTDDGKGQRRYIAGERFRLPAGLESREVEHRFLLMEKIWSDNEAFCIHIGREPVWTDIALWAANCIKKGDARIPLPPIDDILASYGDARWNTRIQLIIDRRTDDELRTNYPPTVDGLEWDEALAMFDVLCERFPSVNWQVPAAHSNEIIRSRETQARWSLEQVALVKNSQPPDPLTPLIVGTFHEALTAYEEKRRKDFTSAEGFDGSGHHPIGLICKMRERMEDFALAELDLTRCQRQFDFWRDRPENLKSAKRLPLNKKTCKNYLGELGRFFEWLHLSNQFAWRKPADFGSLERHIRSLPSDRRSKHIIEIDTFSVDELKILLIHATVFERFLLVWCLNCAHGAAEMGRVAWEDVFLHTEHPWVKQGLQVETSKEDSWCGFLRPKSDVLGWWLLWPETVKLLEWWRSERLRLKKRDLSDAERVLITKNEQSLYRDESKNAQSGFANAWSHLTDRVGRNSEIKVRYRAFGTLRNQLSNWLGGEQAKAIVASVALCHGIPHQGDKLLFKHYSNRPWAALFQAQREYRQYLAPMFDAVPDLLVEHDPVADKLKTLWNSGVRGIATLAQHLGVSGMTVRRKLASLNLKESKPTQG